MRKLEQLELWTTRGGNDMDCRVGEDGFATDDGHVSQGGTALKQQLHGRVMHVAVPRIRHFQTPQARQSLAYTSVFVNHPQKTRFFATCTAWTSAS
jgi:hypothetical protein